MPLNPVGIYYADTSTNMSIADITAAMATSIGDKFGTIQQIQTVSSSAERDALYPTPVQGNSVFRNDLGLTQTYYSVWNIVSNVGGRATAGWYSNQNSYGLVPIVPTSVNITSGTAVVSATGQVVVTGPTTHVQLNGVFTSAYKNYRVIITYSQDSIFSTCLRYTSNGTPFSDNSYSSAGNYGHSSGSSGVIATSNISYIDTSFGGYTNTLQTAIMDIYNPAMSTITKSTSHINTWNTYWVGSTFAGVYNNAVAVDGFRFFSSNGSNIPTANIQVLGYNQ